MIANSSWNFILCLGVEKGTIHTKRHSGEDPMKSVSSKSESTVKGMPDFTSPRMDKGRCMPGQNVSDDISTPTTDTDVIFFYWCSFRRTIEVPVCFSYNRLKNYFRWPNRICPTISLIFQFLSRIRYQCLSTVVTLLLSPNTCLKVRSPYLDFIGKYWLYIVLFFFFIGKWWRFTIFEYIS